MTRASCAGCGLSGSLEDLVEPGCERAPAFVAQRAKPPTDLQQYEGEYGSHVMQVALRVVDGTLTAELNGATAPLVPQDANTFSSMLGPIALFDDLARWRMRCLRKIS